MNLDLINYVKSARQNGLSDGVIKRNLLLAGWRPYEVGGALASASDVSHQTAFPYAKLEPYTGMSAYKKHEEAKYYGLASFMLILFLVAAALGFYMLLNTPL